MFCFACQKHLSGDMFDGGGFCIKCKEKEKENPRHFLGTIAMMYIIDISMRYKNGRRGDKRLSRCMSCGRPFNYTILEHHHYINPKTGVVTHGYKTELKRMEEPKHWNYVDGLCVCDECVNEMHRKFKYRGYDVCIADAKERLDDLYKNYIRPETELID